MTGYSALTGGPRRWDFLASLLGQEKATFVECGTKEGRTSAHILKTCPKAEVIAIDPWAVQLENTNIPWAETYDGWDFAKIEQEFWENVGEHRGRCRMLKMTSAEAVEQVGGEVDMVFVDAAHDRQHVKEDIARWWPLVKDGGILAGHDFNHRWPSVERAVADSFPLMSVGVGPDSVWFVLKNPGVSPRE